MELAQVQNEINIVVVGDDFSGKSSLIGTYLAKEFEIEYRPNMHETYMTEVTVKGKTYSLNIHDIPGSDSYCKLHPCDYPQTNCFIVCFAIDDEQSMNSVRHKWIPEIKYSCEDAGVVLVATKVDLQSVPHQSVIPHIYRRALCKTISTKNYIECSAKTKEGVQNVFDAAIKTVLKAAKRATKKEKKCHCSCIS